VVFCLGISLVWVVLAQELGFTLLEGAKPGIDSEDDHIDAPGKQRCWDTLGNYLFRGGVGRSTKVENLQWKNRTMNNLSSNLVC
jgi:hypothetical protein